MPLRAELDFMNPIVCVNSTLSARKSMVKDRWVSEFHEWGFQALQGDKIYCHRIARVPIIVRARMKGLDPEILCRVTARLLAGYRSLYLVTQPDLLIALPFLKRIFPRLKIVTWVWTAEEAVAWRRQLAPCHHIFCLTNDALEQLNAFGWQGRASLQLLGANPQSYAPSLTPPTYDIAFLGFTSRDINVVWPILQEGCFRIVTTQKAIGQSSQADLKNFMTVLEPSNHSEMVDIFNRSKISWIPLLPGKKETAGYTNMVESLLSGVPVVVADSTILPQSILSLPGVFLYCAGSVDSFREQTHAALEQGSSLQRRQEIREAAAEVLNGVALSNAVGLQLR